MSRQSAAAKWTMSVSAVGSEATTAQTTTPASVNQMTVNTPLAVSAATCLMDG